jgi:predicted membrane chloride channel (bestrophin family)
MIDVRERALRRLAGWDMLVKVLPWVLAAAVAKTIFSLLGLEPIDLNALVSGVVAANVFLLGFLLAGTLADFKESERLPGELAAALESIADECLCVRERGGDPRVVDRCIAAAGAIAVTVRAWLEHRATVDQALDAVRALNPAYNAMQGVTEATFVNRLKVEQANVRRLIVRMDVIRATSFVTAGYVVADVSARLLVLTLLLTELDPLGEGVFFVAVISFLLLYMNRLIRDLDNPFEYKHGSQGAADVSLAALERAQRRLDAAL